MPKGEKVRPPPLIGDHNPEAAAPEDPEGTATCSNTMRTHLLATQITIIAGLVVLLLVQLHQGLMRQVSHTGSGQDKRNKGKRSSLPDSSRHCSCRA